MNNSKGYSLIEAVVTIAVLGIVMSMLTGIIALASSFYLQELDQVNTQSELRLVATHIEKDIRKFNTLTDTFISDENSFTFIKEDDVIEEGTHYVQYTLNGESITRTDVSDVTSSQVLSNLVDIANSSVTSDGNKFEVRLQSIVDMRGNTNIVETDIYIRKGSSS